MLELRRGDSIMFRFSGPIAIKEGSVNMTTIKFIEGDGIEHSVELKDGGSVMQGAIDNGIPGIIAECGGVCACATCHVFVDDDWSVAVGPPATPVEADMLMNLEHYQPSSRLSCQIKVTPALNGLIVRIPKSQGF
jgi:ferredoxin, 2Fe-2S